MTVTSHYYARPNDDLYLTITPGPMMTYMSPLRQAQ